MHYRFAGFELDSDAYKLSRGEREIHLQPLVFDVLRYLVQHRDRIVSKEELLEALWQDGTGNDAAVTWSISHARRALEQTRWQKAPIETVHGRGYRFIAEVSVIDSTPRTPQPDPGGPGRGAAATELQLPFVGRSDIMDQLLAQLLAAEHGAGNLTVLVGEAGLGKTRCANALGSAAEARGFLVLSASSVEGVGAPVFRPWQQILRGLMSAPSSPRERAGELHGQLSAAAHGAEGGGCGGWREPALHSTISGNRVQLFDSVVQLVLEAARRQPLLLLFDDLHWADAGTIELLSFAAPELSLSRCMVLATQRELGSDNNGRALASLSMRGRQIALPYLTRADISRYIADYTRTEEPPIAVSTAVLAATAGNPLFVQETVRSLVADNPASLHALTPSAIRPSKLARDVLRPPLAELAPEEIELLSAASVLGETFELTLLKQVAALGIDTLLDRLEAARRGGFVIAEAPNRYRFRHALIRTILYDDVDAAERVAIHRRAAELLGQAADADQRRSEIAIHYYRSLPAGDPAAVTEASVRAATAAEDVSAFEDAAMFYHWALEAQALESSVGTRERAELLVRCGRAQRLAGREDDARRTLETAIELGCKHDYPDLLVKAAGILRPTHQLSLIPDPLVRAALEQALQTAPDGPHPQRIHALGQLACLPPIALDLEHSKRVSGLALELARERGARNTLLEALRSRLYSLSGPDDVPKLLAVCDEILALDRPRSDFSWRAHVARYAAHLMRGDQRAARAALDAAGHVGKDLNLPEAGWHFERFLAQASIAGGQFAEARTACRALKAVSVRIGLSYGPRLMSLVRGTLEWEEHGANALRGHVDTWDSSAQMQPAASVRSYAARLAAECGMFEAARRNWERLTRHELTDIPRESSYLLTLCNAAVTAVLLRDRARAERLYELLAPYPEYNTPDTVLLSHGSVSRYLALLAAATGRQDRVTEHFEAALAMNARMEYLPQLARTHHDYARWLTQRSSATARDHARTEARKGAKLAEELGMRWLIAATPVQPAPAPFNPA